MSFFKKLFSKKENTEQAITEEQKNPDNTRLLYLLDIYSKNPSADNYRAVLDVIMSGNAYLLLQSVNEGQNNVGWRTLEVGAEINFNCVFNLEGLLVLAAFTDEAAMVEWAKQPVEYTMLPTSAVIDFCKQNNIDRIVINSDQKNMFVMERDRSHITTTKIEEETQVLIGAPAKPLSAAIIDKLKDNFDRIPAIEEAYQFLQQRGEEQSIVIGIRMSAQSENARIALQNAISNALEGEELEIPLDVMMVSDDWLTSLQGIPGSLFYKS